MTRTRSAGRRRFGSVRRLPSGRFQARYRDETGTEYTAPETFPTKTAAARWLATVETDMMRGHWIEPRSGQVTLQSYAEEWLVSRPNLRPRTRELYASLLRLHILPGSVPPNSVASRPPPCGAGMPICPTPVSARRPSRSRTGS